MSSLEHCGNTPALVESFIEDQQCTRQCGRQTCTPSPNHCMEEEETGSLHPSWPFRKRPAGSELGIQASVSLQGCRWQTRSVKKDRPVKKV